MNLEKIKTYSKGIAGVVGALLAGITMTAGLTELIPVWVMVTLVGTFNVATAISVITLSNDTNDERNAKALQKAQDVYMEKLNKAQKSIGVDVELAPQGTVLDDSTDAVMPEANGLMAGNPTTNEGN